MTSELKYANKLVYSLPNGVVGPNSIHAGTVSANWLLRSALQQDM